MTSHRALLVAISLVVLAGCSGVSASNVTCEGDTCDYSIKASSFPENTTMLVREGGTTVDEVRRWEWSNGTVDRGTNVTVYRVNWENETVRKAVTCHTINETCSVEPVAHVSEPTTEDGGDL